MKYARITYTGRLTNASIQLPRSKSISNRLLIMNELSNSSLAIEQLSDSEDTKALIAGLEQMHAGKPLIDVGDAGTAARFLCVLMAVKGFEGVLTGSPRMQERPMFALLDALKELGAQIECIQKQGYLPVRFTKSVLTGKDVEVRADISSQFTSALLMAGPYLPEGLNLHLTGDIASAPYIAMTLKLMEMCGVSCQWRGKVITVPQVQYKPTRFVVEQDWSAAAPFYALCSLAGASSFDFPGLNLSQLQGDMKVVELFKQLGVSTLNIDGGLRIVGGGPVKSFVEADFSECPDLAQSVMAVTAAHLSEGLFTGLHTLHHKETDRFQAMLAELENLGVSTRNDGITTIRVGMGAPKKDPRIQTYHDHRMAMAFAAIAPVTQQIEIENPDVVAKSFLGFWHELMKTGIEVVFYNLP
jgi:3-phosphoshikimate 1-carboxyvinyltransferase